MRASFILIGLLLFNPSMSFAQQSPNPLVLLAPDGSTANITRDNYGVPHITGESEIGVFYAQGYAVAEDRLEQLDQHRRLAEGRLAEILSAAFLDSDIQAIREFYTLEERTQLFNEMEPALKDAFNAYKDGINFYIGLARSDPDRYRPSYFSVVPMLDWTNEATVAVTQYFMRAFGQFGGEELERLAELETEGQAWFDTNRPINDSAAHTTIPGSGGEIIQHYVYDGPSVRPKVAQEIRENRDRLTQLKKDYGIPTTFGSFATLIHPDRSSSGNSLLLGAPQMGAPQENVVSRVNEVELFAPSLHVGGMTVAGIPGVIIGRNEHYSWTMTSGVSDNTDIFIEELESESLTSYTYNGESRDLEEYQATIQVLGGDLVDLVYHRSVHGPIIGDDVANRQAYAAKMTFWKEELNMASAFYRVWKGESLEDFENGVLDSPMSFNVFYTGKDRNIKFWHIGKYQDRSDGVDPRLPHRGDGSQEWTGFIPSSELPKMLNPDQGYFVNWNNKPSPDWNNGDNIPWGNATDLTTRVELIDEFISPITSATFEDLIGVPIHINDTGTYQQILEWSENGTVRDENIVPPGQSGFVDGNFDPSPHKTDQWELHVNSQFKDMEFSSMEPVSNENEVPNRKAILEAFPNPFTDSISLRIHSNASSVFTLRVVDTLGREVLDLNSKLNSQDDLISFGKDLPTGIYLIELSSDSGKTVKSISKLN